MLIVAALHGPSIPVRELDAIETVVFGGRPNRLSEEQKPYPLIEDIHAASKLCAGPAVPSLDQPTVSGRGEISLPSRASTNRGFGRSFGPGVPLLTSEVEASVSLFRNLRLSSQALRSLSSPISLRFGSSICIFMTSCRRRGAGRLPLLAKARRAAENQRRRPALDHVRTKSGVRPRG